jgi:hypothetical protein
MKQKNFRRETKRKQENIDRNSATTSINPAISAQNIGNHRLIRHLLHLR